MSLREVLQKETGLSFSRGNKDYNFYTGLIISGRRNFRKRIKIALRIVFARQKCDNGRKQRDLILRNRSRDNADKNGETRVPGLDQQMSYVLQGRARNAHYHQLMRETRSREIGRNVSKRKRDVSRNHAL